MIVALSNEQVELFDVQYGIRQKESKDTSRISRFILGG